MATDSSRKICVKCVKGNGIVTCDGCYQCFCNKHFLEHRQEILQDINVFSGTIKDFEQTLVTENDPAPLYSAIDHWEDETIGRVHHLAQQYRDEVKQLTAKTLNDFNKFTKKIQININSSREKNDYTEIDLTKWTDQLNSLKQLLKDPFPISVGTNPRNPADFIFLNVNYQSPFKHFNKEKFQVIPTPTQVKNQVKPISFKAEKVDVDIDERFDEIAGHAVLSDDDEVVSFIGFSSALGIKSYGNKIHQIRFEILEKKHDGLFFGIISTKQKITARSSELSSVYGWRDFEKVILNGNAELNKKKTNLLAVNDQITLVIDCDHFKISLIHHRLNQKLLLSVDMQKCPLPWKVLVTSFGEDVIGIMNP